MSEHTTLYTRWYAEGRTSDGVLRHPADGEAWRSFNILHPTFMADNRNVRLSLTFDGFNLFGNMSTSHSTWSVMLAPYYPWPELAWYGYRRLPSAIPHHMVCNACTVQFASLDVHETDVVYPITGYPWPELTWYGY